MPNEINLHWEILDKRRLEFLPKLAVFKNRFYLAGGTAAALYLGHRDSIDFDFFTAKDFDSPNLMEELRTIFQGSNIEEKMSQNNTLTLKIDDVSMSFFKINENQLEPFCETEHINMASLTDIGCMKLSALLGRSVLKDYVDLYAICKTFIPLGELLEKAKLKYPTVNSGAFVRALGYYGDIQMDKIIFKNDFYVDIETIEEFFKNEIKKLFNL
jgi:hypothetical protein